MLERLMEKGLMPLAALDVIRGWLLLKMAVSNEEERRLIKPATRNKLSRDKVSTFSNVRRSWWWQRKRLQPASRLLPGG